MGSCLRTSPSLASVSGPRATPTSGSARARDGIEKFSRQPIDEQHWADFARALFYVPGSFNESRAYQMLKEKLEAVDQQFGIPGNRVYYLSIPPQFISTCVEHLHSSGMVPRS